MINPSILTKTEEKVIEKKLKNKKLTKQDSYYLSVSIRPKLRQVERLAKMNLLKRMSYNRKSKTTDDKIKNIILKKINKIKAIVLYGSIVQNNYSNYKDIDVLIITNKNLWKNKKEKLNLINKIEEKAKKENLNLDIQIIDKKTLDKTYSSNLSLIYQLKDNKTIYGKLKLPKKIEIPKILLKMKMDWSEPYDDPEGNEIYNCIRNTLLVRLILEKTIDNYRLSGYINEELGRNLTEKLKENNTSPLEKSVAIKYLKEINKDTLNKINNEKWEKIVI